MSVLFNSFWYNISKCFYILQYFTPLYTYHSFWCAGGVDRMKSWCDDTSQCWLQPDATFGENEALKEQHSKGLLWDWNVVVEWSYTHTRPKTVSCLGFSLDCLPRKATFCRPNTKVQLINCHYNTVHLSLSRFRAQFHVLDSQTYSFEINVVILSRGMWLWASRCSIAVMIHSTNEG